MAKTKKNTLAELNEFLQNSGATASDGDSADYLKSKPHTLVEVDKLENMPEENSEEISEREIIERMMKLARQKSEDVRMTLFRIIQQVVESKEEVNSSDLMLTNVALYLEHTEKMGQGYAKLLKNSDQK